MQQDSTPKKPARRGPKPKENTANDYCRFCNCQLVLKYGNVKKNTYLSTENLFKVPKDSVCSKTLADLCLELGFKLKDSVHVSSRVCKACGRNLRSTYKFYKLIETAIGKEIPDVQVVETDDENSADEPRVKRQLPTTISPERSRSKTVKIQGTPTRKSLNFKNTEQPEQNNENQDNVLSALNIEDLLEKKTSQVKVVIVNPSGKVETWHNFDEDRKSLLLNIARNKWTTVENLMFKNPKLKKELDKPLERAIGDEFKELCRDSAKSVLLDKSPEDVAKLTSKTVFDEIRAKCPLWGAVIQGAGGVRDISSAPNKKINGMALSSAIAARTRNHKMSAMAYRISTILFHSGVKSEDLTRLSRLGVCMSPDQVVEFQKKMGKTCYAKLEVWKKDIEKVKKAELLLKEVLDCNDEKSLDLSDTSCSHFKYYSKEVAEHCRSVLQSVAQQGVFTREMLNAAVAQLKSCTLPTYK
jgi:hypothetical protein